MKKDWIIGVIALVLVLALTNFTSAETIILKSGQKIEGEIIEKTDEYIKVDISGVSVPYFMDEVTRIESTAPAVSMPTTIHSTSTPLTDKTPEEIFASASPAVVYIVSMTATGEKALGSGFIIDNDGVVVTNYHVIYLTKEISVKLTDGRSYPVTGVINYDVNRDICILKIDANNLPTVDLGNSDKAQIGEKIYAIGNPLGLEYTFSDGMLSGTRDYQGIEYLQFTAPVSPGNSGGPLISEQGQILGIVTFVRAGGQNLNFALAINEISAFIGKTPRMTMQEFVGKITKADYLLIVGAESFLAGEYAQALEFYKEAEEINPELSHINNCIGVALGMLGRHQDAIPYFEKAVQLDSADVRGYLNLGNIYIELGRPQEAMTYAEKCIEINPGEYSAYFILGSAYYLLNDLDKSMSYYQKALQINPRDAETYFAVGGVYYSQDNYKQAIPFLLKSNDLRPNNVEVLMTIGLSYFHLDMHEDAQKILLHTKKIAEAQGNKDYVLAVDKFLKENYKRKKFLNLF